MNELADLLPLLESPWNFLWLLLIFGVAPGFCLRVIVLLYPKGHERRAELIGELYAMPWHERPLFVAQQLETAVSEGVPARLTARRMRKRRRADVWMSSFRGRVMVERALLATHGHSEAVIVVGRTIIVKSDGTVRVTSCGGRPELRDAVNAYRREQRNFAVSPVLFRMEPTGAVYGFDEEG